MRIDFPNREELLVQSMNGGASAVAAKLFQNEWGKVIVSRILPGASIGPHVQKTGNDINFVVSCTGLALCDGDEPLSPWMCRYCLRGQTHSVVNTGKEDLVLWTVVQEL